MSDKKIEVFSPFEIKDYYTQIQIERQAEILGIDKDILIRFNQDMRKEGKEINFLTLKEWLITGDKNDVPLADKDKRVINFNGVEFKLKPFLRASIISLFTIFILFEILPELNLMYLIIFMMLEFSALYFIIKFLEGKNKLKKG
ncbi:hypothetical protein [uncultured Vagococcus sp.]|uniref:hypothetical protein n=1 Tax=uncultured Vagococcus sp. TaxID=189676 RepID=UPI00258EDAB0|nr:hypothetical protein [uncultured Vagococcus sp.]